MIFIIPEVLIVLLIIGIAYLPKLFLVEIIVLIIYLTHLDNVVKIIDKASILFAKLKFWRRKENG